MNTKMKPTERTVHQFGIICATKYSLENYVAGELSSVKQSYNLVSEAKALSEKKRGISRGDDGIVKMIDKVKAMDMEKRIESGITCKLLPGIVRDLSLEPLNVVLHVRGPLLILNLSRTKTSWNIGHHNSCYRRLLQPTRYLVGW